MIHLSESQKVLNQFLLISIEEIHMGFLFSLLTMFQVKLYCHSARILPKDNHVYQFSVVKLQNEPFKWVISLLTISASELNTQYGHFWLYSTLYSTVYFNVIHKKCIWIYGCKYFSGFIAMYWINEHLPWKWLNFSLIVNYSSGE